MLDLPRIPDRITSRALPFGLLCRTSVWEGIDSRWREPSLQHGCVVALRTIHYGDSWRSEVRVQFPNRPAAWFPLNFVYYT